MKKILLIIMTFPASVKKLFMAQMLLGLGTGVFSVLLNLYLREIGYTEEIIGRLLAAQSLCAALMSIPMGWLADRASRRTTYLLGVALLGCGFSVIGLTRSLNTLFAAVFLAGSGSGAMMVSVIPYLQENGRQRQRKYIFSANVTLMWTTSIFAGFIAGWLPKFFKMVSPGQTFIEADRLQYSLWVGLVFIFLALIPARGLAGKADHDKAARHERQNAASPVALSRPWLIIGRFAFCQALIGFGAGMIVPYFNLYFRDWVGSSIPQIGFVFALGQFGTALGSILSPVISHRFGLIRGVAWSQLCSLPFMALMAWRHEFWICAACFVFRGAFMNMCVPMRQETMMEIIPDHLRARASAFDSMAWNMAWALAMFFSGGIIKDYGYDVSLVVAFCCYLASALIYLHLFLPWERLQKSA
ncbi:MAG TPA: MFS transporter [Candidatus Rifleibacterium sp.]|nr:MFS transporter [Candidatus Rifleibacterium sp.]